MNKINCETYFAKATIGLYKGYSNSVITKAEFKETVFDVQSLLKHEKGVLLSVKMKECVILFLGQDEPSITLEFINYPKFPLELEAWKQGVTLFVERLMSILEQNRVVIVFHDETVMIENTHEIDPRISIQRH